MSKKDVWDDPDAREFLESAARDMLPKMKDSALSVTLFSGKVDPKLCVELGAAILLDKPIVLVVTDESQIPSNLEKVAAEIVRVNFPGDPEAAQRKLQAAISRVMEHKV